MSSSTSQQINVARGPTPPNAAASAFTLAELITRREFDFTKFGEKSYFIILKDLRGNVSVGKADPSTKLQHVLHYLCDAWGYPQRNIIYAYNDVFRVLRKGCWIGCEVVTFGGLQLEKDGSDGDAEVLYLIERQRGC